MIIDYSTREQTLLEAEKELKKFQQGIDSGFWVGMGYTEQETNNTLEECKKWIDYLKGECSWTEYHIAYAKAHKFRWEG